MKLFYWNAVAVVILLTAGCAGSPPAEHEAAVDLFPDHRFMTAEAVGDTEGEAKRAAMADLAAIFESRVYARTIQQATSWMEEGLPEQFDRQVEQTVHIHTDVQLQGARIGRVWSNEPAGGFRAIAVLDRRQSASRWQRELAKIHLTIEGQKAALDAVNGRLSRLAALNHITALMLRQAAIESRLNVLGQPVSSGADDRADIIVEHQRLVHDVALFIQLQGDPALPFTQRLGAQLSGDGYTLTPYRDDAAGLITGTIDLQPLNLGNPKVHFIRAVADVQLVDMDTGTQMAAFNENLRKGHVDEAEAARRSVDGLAVQVAVKLARALGTLGVTVK